MITTSSVGYNPDFDLEAELPDWTKDRAAGESAESFAKYLLDNVDSAKFECKLDRKWQKTGYIYLEYESWSRSQRCYVPSGIQTSKAQMWVYVLPLRDHYITVFISAAILSDAFAHFQKAKGNRAEEKDGDCPTRGVLIPHDLPFRTVPTTES